MEFSRVAANRIGLLFRQHQALLAIKGFLVDRSPTLGGWPSV
ncbi:hypothetical protein [Rhodopila sp.]|nr:hypothetical protein [Rhodopila sp.]HVZ07518.1 hypothetical protein [Rhodopila sp.]